MMNQAMLQEILATIEPITSGMRHNTTGYDHYAPGCEKCKLRKVEVRIRAALDSPAYPKPCGLCPKQILSAEDTEWHGLGNCVPICERCGGSGIEVKDVRPKMPTSAEIHAMSGSVDFEDVVPVDAPVPVKDARPHEHRLCEHGRCTHWTCGISCDICHAKAAEDAPRTLRELPFRWRSTIWKMAELHDQRPSEDICADELEAALRAWGVKEI